MSLHRNTLLTRDAEGLFWMARYLERVENLARLIDVTQMFEGPTGEANSWSALVAINEDGKSLEGQVLDGPTVKRFYLLDATTRRACHHRWNMRGRMLGRCGR